MSEDISKSITWNSRLEEYFCSTGERAHGLAWIHSKAEALYSRRRTCIDLPVIVCSGILGFLSVGSSSMFAGYEETSSVLVGLGSLFVSVLNTVGSYFQFAKKAEGHRIASLQYAKLHRFLSVEMSLPRDERMTAYELLKTTKETFDRLMEISPTIPPEVIQQFKKTFKDQKYDDISKPAETNGLEAIKPYSYKGSRPSESSLQSPLSTYPETPLPPPRQTQFQPQKGNHEKEGIKVNTSLGLHSQPTDLPNDIPQRQSRSSDVEV